MLAGSEMPVSTRSRSLLQWTIIVRTETAAVDARRFESSLRPAAVYE